MHIRNRLLFMGAIVLISGGIIGLTKSTGLLGAQVLKIYPELTTTLTIQYSEKNPDAFIFDYQFLKPQEKSAGSAFDLAIKPFKDTDLADQLPDAIKSSMVRDQWRYPIRENAYFGIQKIDASETINPGKKGKKNIFEKFIDFIIGKAQAFDADPSLPGLVNCRATMATTGYFKAYFEDVALHNGVGYDDASFGPARQAAACQALQEIADVLQLDTTNVTPDILFMANPGNIPAGALAAASSYFDFHGVTGYDNGFLHRHIVNRIDPTPAQGLFDAFIITNFDASIAWDSDSNLNSGTYSLQTVLEHEMMHALGFGTALDAVITQTNIAHGHGTYDEGLFENQNLSNKFFNATTKLLQVPTGAPSPWFVTNAVVYRGIKNIIGATPDGIRPVYSPNQWEQGSSLSHFDMVRAGGGIDYLMNAVITTNTVRSLHDHEKQVLCHEGYQVLGITGCSVPTPKAIDDTVNITVGGTACINYLANDGSFANGVITTNNMRATSVQSGDIITYYTGTGCTGTVLATAPGAKSLRFTAASSTSRRLLTYQNQDSVTQRISFPAEITINVTSVMACQDTYYYASQWGQFGTGSSQFNTPFGITVDAQGNVYVADTGNHRVQKFDANGNFVLQWGSLGTFGQSKFMNPTSILVDSNSNVYVLDSLGRMQKFTSTGTFISEWNTTGLSNPQGSIDSDSAGNIYITDTGNNQIKKFSPSGNLLLSWGSYGSGNGQFNNPIGVTVDSSGYVYVSDNANHRIQKFTSTGTFVTTWGSQGSADGQFSGPSTVVADSSGNIYVADNSNDRIQKFTGTGTFLGKWGTTGSGNGELLLPGSLAINAVGEVYVLDTDNNRVQKFVTNCDICPNLPGMQNTVPAGYQLVNGMCLANANGVISGRVFQDTNQDGIINIGESGLSGVSVALYAQGSTTPTQVITTGNTPNLGNYEFSGLANGTYYVVLTDESTFSAVSIPATAPGLVTGHDHVYTVVLPGTGTQKNFGVVLGTGSPTTTTTDYHFEVRRTRYPVAYCGSLTPAPVLMTAASSCADASTQVTNFVASYPTCYPPCPSGGTQIFTPTATTCSINANNNFDVTVSFVCSI